MLYLRMSRPMRHLIRACGRTMYGTSMASTSNAIFPSGKAMRMRYWYTLYTGLVAVMIFIVPFGSSPRLVATPSWMRVVKTPVSIPARVSIGGTDDVTSLGAHNVTATSGPLCEGPRLAADKFPNAAQDKHCNNASPDDQAQDRSKIVNGVKGGSAIF